MLAVWQSRVLSVWRDVAKQPTLSAGRLETNGTCNSYQLDWKQLNPDLARNEKFTTTHVVLPSSSGDSGMLAVQLGVVESAAWQCCIPSETRSYRFIVTGNEDEQVYEVWGADRLEASVKRSDKLDFGPAIIGKSSFQNPTWDGDDTIMFLAKRKEDKKSSWFDPPDEKSTPGVQYVEEPDWGEQLTGIRDVVIVLYDWKQRTFITLDELSKSDLCPIQATWLWPGQLVVIAMHTKPTRLGLIYCRQRPASLVVVEVASRATRVLVERAALYSMTIAATRSARTLLWFESTPFGPHNKGFTGKIVRFANKDASLDSLSLNSSADLDGGRLFYLADIYPRLGTGTDTRIYFNSLNAEQATNWVQVLQLTDDGNLNGNSRSICPGKLLDRNGHNDCGLVTAFSGFADNPFKIEIIHGLSSHSACLDDNVPKCIPYPEVATELYGAKSGNYFLLEAEGPHRGTILLPHGGPHSIITADYSQYNVAFRRLGFAMAVVNFPGSLGLAEEKLTGHIGSVDVAYCAAVAKEVQAKLGGPLFVHGGSHGGFLTLHLSSEYPELFKAAAARNPASDVGHKFSSTDIPDWCFVETFGADFPYQVGQIPTPEKTFEMLKKSPAMNMETLTVPLLLMMGTKDRRLPPSQSLFVYRALKLLQRDVKLLSYEDEHPLSTPPVLSDAFVNIAMWFINHEK